MLVYYIIQRRRYGRELNIRPMFTNTLKNNINFLEKKIRAIKDYPKKGIIYQDITPLLRDPLAFSLAIDLCCEQVDVDVDLIAAIDARGFILGSGIAYKTGKGIIPVRKINKLPYEVITEKYSLEYGYDQIELHTDSIESGQKIVLVDDVLATGGTTEAAIKLIDRLGGHISAIIFLLELTDLKGRKKIAKYADNIHSLIEL